MERGEGWQAELAESFTDSLQLLRFVEVEPRQLLGASAPLGFPVKVTRSYARRIGKGDPNDPLLLQVLPLPDEQFAAPGFTLDPVGDSQALVVPGVLHKYAGRALFVATGACAVNCRYCFRRGFPYSEQQLARSSEEAALAYIAGDESIEEVILSGGDPLLLSDRRLGGLLDTLAGIPHLRRIRLHTRVPVVLPSRITSRFVAVVSGSRLQPVVVIHANHPAEWTPEVGRALRALAGARVTLLNQAVLLRGVNDDVSVLADLSERFFQSGVLPYYLHLLDRVLGAAHFEVPEERALALHEDLRRRLPGYLVPRLAREEAGQPYKLLL